MSLEIATEEELKRRLDVVMTRIHVICQEIAPKLEQIGKYREEAQVIYDELHRRGLVPAYQPPPIDDGRQISLSGSDSR